MYFWRLVGEVISKSDIVLIIGDSRTPVMSINRRAMEIVRKENRHMLIVLNKSDLLSEKGKKDFHYEKDTFLVSARTGDGISELRRKIQIISKRLGRDEPKIGVIGYPNMGKSAVINALARSAKAKIANKPGTTRGIQWVKAGRLRILDSPGVIPLGDRGKNLVFIGAKRPEKLEHPEILAMEIIGYVLSENPDALKLRYGIDKDDEYEILLEIGRKRGFYKKKGEVDEKKTAIVIIQDWQNGRIKI